MKRILLAATFLGATFFTNAYAQFTGGSAGRGTVPTTTTTTTKAVKDRGVFDNAFYMRVGQSTPKGKFGEASNTDKPSQNNFNGVSGSGAQKGFVAEMGLLSYFREIPLPERVRLGLDVNLAVALNNMEWNNQYATSSDIIMSQMAFAGVKIGPAISYNPISKLIFDGFFKFNPSICTSPDLNYHDSNNNGDSYSYTLQGIDLAPVFAVRKSLGLNMRYSALMVGMEYNFGKVKYELEESHYYSVNYSTTSTHNIVEVETPTSMFIITGGFKF